MIAILGLGRVGRRVARALRARGETVRASHREPRADPDADDVVALDLAHPRERRERALSALARGARVLVWSASRYDADLLATVSARVLLLSSVSVYTQDAGETVTEDDRGPAPRDETARELRRAEDFVLGRGGAVLRLAGIYARGRGPQTLLASAPRDPSGRPRLEPPASKLLNLIHEEDAARAALFALDRGLEGAWNVSDGAPLTRAAFYSLAARSLGLAEPVFGEGGPASLGKRVSNTKLLGQGFELLHSDAARGIELP